MDRGSPDQAGLDSEGGQAASADDPNHGGAPELDRRQFLQLIGGGAIAVSAHPLEVAAQPGPDTATAPATAGTGDSRRDVAYRIRHDAAMHRYRLAAVDHPTNGDEERFPDYRVSFGKTLPHNELGEVDPDAFRALLSAVRS